MGERIKTVIVPTVELSFSYVLIKTVREREGQRERARVYVLETEKEKTEKMERMMKK